MCRRAQTRSRGMAVSSAMLAARDAAKADAAFAAHGGDKSKFDVLIAEPKLALVIAALRESVKTTMIRQVSEWISKATLIMRYPNLENINPLVSGNAELVQLSEAADIVLDKAIAAAPSDLVARLTHQFEAAETAFDDALIDQRQLPDWSPAHLKPVLEPMLAAVCVMSIR
jgi:hypothetical protein